MPRKMCAALVAGLSCLALAACGGAATVDHEDAAPAASASPSRDAHHDAGKDSGKEQKPTPRKEQSSASGEGDRGAREIEEVPAPSPAQTREEREYLEALTEGGVDVGDTGDSLIGAARSVCEAPKGSEGGRVTADAVAGQLIEQHKTKLGHEETAKLIVDSARAKYC